MSNSRQEATGGQPAQRQTNGPLWTHRDDVLAVGPNSFAAVRERDAIGTGPERDCWLASPDNRLAIVNLANPLIVGNVFFGVTKGDAIEGPHSSQQVFSGSVVCTVKAEAQIRHSDIRTRTHRAAPSADPTADQRHGGLRAAIADRPGCTESLALCMGQSDLSPEPAAPHSGVERPWHPWLSAPAHRNTPAHDGWGLACPQKPSSIAVEGVAQRTAL